MTIVFLDIETTGLDPDRHDIWELALIVRRDGRREFERHWQFRPNLATADPAALRIGRYYERNKVLATNGLAASALELTKTTGGMALGDYLASDVAREVAKLLDGATLVGAIPSFDAAFIDRWLRKYGQCSTWHHRLRCVESLTAGHLSDPNVGGLAGCCKALGIAQEGEHTALGDARAARDIWDRVFPAAS